MPRIQDTKGRTDENSGYVRLLGNSRLGLLISKVHATVIRSGNELERLLENATPSTLKTELPQAISQAKTGRSKGTKVVFSPRIRKTSGSHGITGDILAFNFSRRTLSVIEVKDGDTFDTKKSSGELQSMQAFAVQLSRQTRYEPAIYFCSFNQESKESIVAGAKGRFSPQQVMTGRELCAILKINYDQFRAARRQEQALNLEYFIRELFVIPEIAERLRRLFK